MKTINLNKVVIMMIISVFLLSLFTMSCGKKETTDNSQKDYQSTQKETPMNNDADMNKDHAMIKVSSMQCGTCKKNIETAVRESGGIIDVKVDLDEKMAHVNFDKSKTDITKIEAAITSAGYDANDKKADPNAYNELDDCCKLPKDQKEKSGH